MAGENGQRGLSGETRRTIELLEEHRVLLAQAQECLEMMALLQEGLEQVANRLETALSTVCWRAPEEHARKDFLDREQIRRELAVKRLRGQLNFGKRLIRRAVRGEEEDAPAEPGAQAETAGGQDDGVSAPATDDRAEALQRAQRDAERSYTIALTYVRTIVVPETRTLWEHRWEVLQAQLASSAVPQEYVDVRDQLWDWWVAALGDAGLVLDTPKEGDRVDFDRHEVAGTELIAEPESANWHERITRLTAPGIRWSTRDLLLAYPRVVTGIYKERQPDAATGAEGTPAQTDEEDSVAEGAAADSLAANPVDEPERTDDDPPVTESIEVGPADAEGDPCPG